MKTADEDDFIRGISDRALRVAYGFPADMENTVSEEIFQHFCRLDNTYSLTKKNSVNMVAFLLDVMLELPDELKAALSGNGELWLSWVSRQTSKKGT